MDGHDSMGTGPEPLPPPGYVQYSQVRFGLERQPSNPPLTAAGVMSILEGAGCVLLTGLGLMLATGDTDEGWFDFRRLGIFMAFWFGPLAVIFLVGGIAAVRRRAWGRKMLLIVYGLITFLLGVALIRAFSVSGVELAPVVFTAWHVVVLVLATKGRVRARA